jgi:hypothetical protein
MDFINEASGHTGPSPDIIASHLADLYKKADAMRLPETDLKPTITEALKRARIDPKIEPEETPLIASIDSTPFATLGNFSCIIGKAKSKKTFLMTLIVATFLKGEVSILQAYTASGKKRVIWFDTEQSRNHVVKAYRRALAISCEAEFYDIEVYDLRPFSPKERLEMISQVLREQNPDNDIAFVVIDGIRDLVTDINDPVQATDITTWLMKVTGDKLLHVCTVLHQNKSDNNARGHLGTEIVNKAETVLSVTKDSDTISSVKAEFCRDREFKPFAFTIDEVSGLPQILQGYSVSGDGEGGSKGNSGAFIPDAKHRELMVKIFGFESEYSYGDLHTQVVLQYNDANIRTGQIAGKGIIAKCCNLGIIKKDGKPGSKGKYILTKSDG